MLVMSEMAWNGRWGSESEAAHVGKADLVCADSSPSSSPSLPFAVNIHFPAFATPALDDHDVCTDPVLRLFVQGGSSSPPSRNPPGDAVGNCEAAVQQVEQALSHHDTLIVLSFEIRRAPIEANFIQQVR